MLYPQYFIDDLKTRADPVRMISFLTVLMVLTVGSFAQEKPKAIEIDEFGYINCDEMLARIDNFSIQLHNNPTAKGFVAVTGSRDQLVKKIQLEILYTSGVIQRRMDSSRVSVIHGKEAGEPKMYFWLIPNGGDEPDRDQNLGI